MTQEIYSRANIPIANAYPREIRELYLNVCQRLVPACNWKYADWVIPPGSLAIGIYPPLDYYYCLYILTDDSLTFQALTSTKSRYNVVYKLEGFFVASDSEDSTRVDKPTGQTLEEFIFENINKRILMDYVASWNKN